MRKHIFTIFFLALGSLAVHAQPKGFKTIASEQDFRKKMVGAANAIQTIKSDFTQEKNINVLSEKIVSKGTFVFKKQNKVRMEYVHPFKYLMVIDQDKVIIKDEQKTNSFSSKSNKLFATLNRIIIDCAQGTAVDNKDFSPEFFENERQYLLVLKPQKKELKEFFSGINIFLEKQDFSINHLDMQEASGDNTVITFTNKQFNVNIPDAVFSAK
jgi:outer membrane lipoprotein-sorting protein